MKHSSPTKKPKLHRNPETTGSEERIRTQKRLEKETKCNKDVIQNIGIYEVTDIYRYFIIKLEADRTIIDRDLTRTQYIDTDILPRTDLDNKKKLEIIEKHRDQHLCRILNKLYKKYKLSSKNVPLDDFFIQHVNQAIRDYLKHQEEQDMQSGMATPPMERSEGGGRHGRQGRNRRRRRR